MGNDVEIWFEAVDRRPPDPWLVECLADDERAQANRFRFERDRARFVARRAFRRCVLAGYLDVEPARICIRTSVMGRPEVESLQQIHFSASHSDGLAVVAVTRGQDIGVDLERVRPIPEAQELADRLFARRECERVRSVEPAARSEVFLTLWTRKESVVKAAGVGLSMPVDGFDVLAPDVAVATQRGEDPLRPFVLASLDLMPGYVGSVAVSGTDDVAVRVARTAAAW